MERERNPSPPDAEPGDYGYDLAHEVRSDEVAPAWRPQRPEEGVHVSTETDDHGQDLGYDLAHDVPPARREE
jgi:hypothetical protein